ncbi:ArsR/SmtB family transcription factor [Actinoplanes sp. NPDC049599]|uniref:ArsR/SmtB family transcription factor n=1 Tax=Actinoplanes sp. NPDC049599 TaxID=3363903 RepID=UPI0037981A2F
MAGQTFLEADSVAAANLLGAVANPVRWRLLVFLSDGVTRCVCELQPVAAVSAGLLSYHLRVLREAGLLRADRRGTWVDYTIVPDVLEQLHRALPTPGYAGSDPAADQEVAR